MKRCDRCRFYHAHPPARSADEMVFAHDGVYGGGQCRRHAETRSGSAAGHELELATFSPMTYDGFYTLTARHTVEPS